MDTQTTNSAEAEGGGSGVAARRAPNAEEEFAAIHDFETYVDKISRHIPSSR
jgi:hypothetical protein